MLFYIPWVRMGAILLCTMFLVTVSGSTCHPGEQPDCNPDIPNDQIWEIDQQMCKGKVLWSNGTDLMLCRTHNWKKCPLEAYAGKGDCSWTCSHIYSRCNKTGGGGWPGQCVRNDKLLDQEYTCLDRSDIGASTSEGGTLDFSRMIRCQKMWEDGNEKSGTYGFLCNGECRKRSFWCNSPGGLRSGIEACSELEGLSPHDPQLCGNFSFWSEAPACEDFRCNGAYSGQCADSVATMGRSNWIKSYKYCPGSNLPTSKCIGGYTEVAAILTNAWNCEDKSNLILPICEPYSFDILDPFGQSTNCVFPPDICKNNQTVHAYCREVCEKEKEIESYECFIRDCYTPCSMCNSFDIRCPNPEYFWCPGNGPALHPYLVCDQHPQCPNGEDEWNCLHEYRRKNLTKKEAHFECKSIYHPNVTLEAIVCDGRTECLANLDESGCKNSLLNYFLVITLLILTGVSFLYPRLLIRIFRQEQSMELSETIESGSLAENIKSANNDEKIGEVLSCITNWHTNPVEDYRTSMLRIQAMKMKDEDREQKNVLIYNMEAKIHDFSKRETHLCLKNNQSNQTCKAVLEAVYPGVCKCCIPQRLKNLFTMMTNNQVISWTWFIVKRFLRVSLFYLDFLKDSFIILALINLTGFSTLLKYPMEFTSQIILLLLISVILPILCASAYIAMKHPLAILGYQNPEEKTKLESWKVFALQMFIVTHGLMVPAILIDLKEKEKNDFKTICQKNSQDRTVRSRELFLNLVKRLILVVKKLELSIEISIQVTVPLIMICLQLSNTKTVTGFESVFKADPIQLPGLAPIPSETVLVLSILVSFRTAIFTFFKLKSVERDSFVPTVGKIVLVMRGTMALLIRFVVIIIYFTPCMGLMGILAHHRRDIIPFNPIDTVGMDFYEEGSKLSYWYEDKIHAIPWTSVYKHYITYDSSGTPGTNTKAHYKDYTVMDLQSAYIIFWIIMASQLIIASATKTMFSKQFRKSSVGDKFQHCLNILHIPDVFQEWDESCEDINSIHKRWRMSKLEMLVACMVHWVTNIALVLPACLTGLNIIARHEIIVPAIGAFQDEEYAYQLAKIFLWLPLLIVTLASIADYGLFLLYNRFGHPWKDLLLEDEIIKNPDENIDNDKKRDPL